MPTRDEIAYEVLLPYFQAVKDAFVEFEVLPGVRLERLTDTKLVIDAKIHDTPRHFAACRDDGLCILAAPQLIDIPVEHGVAIFAHEFGHATDFCYPAQWQFTEQGKPAKWELEGGRGFTRRVRHWQEREDHLVEWSADAIAQAVTGRVIKYSGPCMLQRFSKGVLRPEALR